MKTLVQTEANKLMYILIMLAVAGTVTVAADEYAPNIGPETINSYTASTLPPGMRSIRVDNIATKEVPAHYGRAGIYRSGSGDPKAYNPVDLLLGGVQTGNPPSEVDEYQPTVTVFGIYTYVSFHTADGYIFIFQTTDGTTWYYNSVMGTNNSTVKHCEVAVDTLGYVYLTAQLTDDTNTYAAVIRSLNPNSITEFWAQGWITFTNFPCRVGSEGSPSIGAATSTDFSVGFPSVFFPATWYSPHILRTTDGGNTWNLQVQDFSVDCSNISVKYTNQYINATCEVEDTSHNVAHWNYSRSTYGLVNLQVWDLYSSDEVLPHMYTSDHFICMVFSSNFYFGSMNVLAIWSNDDGGTWSSVNWVVYGALYRYTKPRVWLNGVATYVAYCRSSSLSDTNKVFIRTGNRASSWTLPVQVSDSDSNLANHYHAIGVAHNVSQNRTYLAWSDTRNSTLDIYYNANPPPPTRTPSPTQSPTSTPTRTPTLSPTRTSSPTPTLTATKTPTLTPTISPTPIATLNVRHLPEATLTAPYTNYTMRDPLHPNEITVSTAFFVDASPALTIWQAKFKWRLQGAATWNVHTMQFFDEIGEIEIYRYTLAYVMQLGQVFQYYFEIQGNPDIWQYPFFIYGLDNISYLTTDEAYAALFPFSFTVVPNYSPTPTRTPTITPTRTSTPATRTPSPTATPTVLITPSPSVTQTPVTTPTPDPIPATNYLGGILLVLVITGLFVVHGVLRK